jgi:cytochrome c peroxidase
MNDDGIAAHEGLTGGRLQRGGCLTRQRSFLNACAHLSVLALVVVLTACGAPAADTPAADTPAAPPLPPTATPAARATAPATVESARTAGLPLAAQRTQFPPIVAPPDNPTTAQRIDLGRQLFFDPVLSASNAMACATCHHPDLGFSNGAAISPPRAGAPGRNVPTVWNAAFNRHLLWDGRVESLEAQAVDPLTLPNEMAATPAEIEAELGAIPAYVGLFDAAFGGGRQAVTFDNVTRALAAFERTLLSNDSRFDRFVAGAAGALTPQEQRGLALFFSPETRCAECHQPPTFAHETFRVVGVPSEDPGRAGVSPTGVRGAFRVPTLRNVALTAPYMHNGSLATLEDVVQFYADGAGRANGFPSVDPLLKGFDLSGQDKADLVAFLRALTDERALPAVPEQALSGLPVVPRIANPAP